MNHSNLSFSLLLIFAISLIFKLQQKLQLNDGLQMACVVFTNFSVRYCNKWFALDKGHDKNFTKPSIDLGTFSFRGMISCYDKYKFNLKCGGCRHAI